MVRFSERIGKAIIPTELSKEQVSDELRNMLWTIFLEIYIAPQNDISDYGQKYSDQSLYFRQIWMGFFKYPIDTLSISYGQVDSGYAMWCYKTAESFKWLMVMVAGAYFIPHQISKVYTNKG